MKKLPLLFLLALGCGPKHEPCTPEGRAALLELYKTAVDKTLATGTCDQYKDVAKCPAYRAIELHFAAAEKGLCQ